MDLKSAAAHCFAGGYGMSTARPEFIAPDFRRIPVLSTAGNLPEDDQVQWGNAVDPERPIQAQLQIGPFRQNPVRAETDRTTAKLPGSAQTALNHPAALKNLVPQIELHGIAPRGMFWAMR